MKIFGYEFRVSKAEKPAPTQRQLFAEGPTGWDRLREDLEGHQPDQSEPDEELLCVQQRLQRELQTCEPKSAVAVYTTPFFRLLEGDETFEARKADKVFVHPVNELNLQEVAAECALGYQFVLREHSLLVFKITGEAPRVEPTLTIESGKSRYAIYRVCEVHGNERLRQRLIDVLPGALGLGSALEEIPVPGFDRNGSLVRTRSIGHSFPLRLIAAELDLEDEVAFRTPADAVALTQRLLDAADAKASASEVVQTICSALRQEGFDLSKVAGLVQDHLHASTRWTMPTIRRHWK